MTAEDDIRARVEGASPLPPPPPAPDDGPNGAGRCPVTCLGHDLGQYFFLTREGQFRVLRHREIEKTGILSLFGTGANWLPEAFPVFDRDGDIKPGAWGLAAAQAYLFREAHRAGFFAPARTVRGPGVWAKEGGGLIVHCGDALLIDGAWRPAGCRVGPHIYPAGPALTRPAATALEASKVGLLHDFFGAWVWRSPVHAPRLIIGWLGAALCAGALRWRPHVQVTAPAGSGKSTLEGLVRQLLGNAAMAVSAPTEAGIRQALAGAARPVLVDEIETEHPERARKVIEIARLASTDGQGEVYRGSAEGKATAWPMRACFWFSSILHVRFRPQDLGRICVLEFDRPPVGEDAAGETAQAKVRAGIERFARYGPRLWRRAIDGWPRFLANLEIYEAQLARLGRQARLADQLGTLLAWAETLLSDEVVSEAAAFAICQGFDVANFAGHEDEEDQVDCLQHLLTSDIAIPHSNGGTQRLPIGELLRKIDGQPARTENADLRRAGVACWRDQRGGGIYLAVANRARALEQIFQGTRWADGVWKQALRRLPGAMASPDKVSFGGSKERATMVPWMALPLPDDPSPPPRDHQPAPESPF